MPMNVEIKARLRNGISDVESLLNEETKKGSWIITTQSRVSQIDTFFNTSKGRLKLREEKTARNPHQSTLIAYQRVDKEGPKSSDYILTPVADPRSLIAALTMAVGVKGVVAKNRDLYIIKTKGGEFDEYTTRVHLDTVEGLGEFLEFEILIEKNQDVRKGEEFAEILVSLFGIPKEDLISVAYLDMLIERDDN